MPVTPRLHELQQGFADALTGRGNAIAAWVEGAGLDPSARLRIYRNAVASTLTTALRESYSTVLALVGDDFFDAMAARYRQQHPSTCGNLQRFGGALARFIADMPEAQTLDYLADVARLDWLRQSAALAPDATPVGLAARTTAAMAEPHRLRIRLHPSLRLLASAHAVLTIWRWCREPTESSLRLNGNSEYVLLWRDGGDVSMSAIDPATFRCIETLAAGRDLASAYVAATDVDSAFDLEPCLRDLLAHGLIVAFINEESST